MDDASPRAAGSNGSGAGRHDDGRHHNTEEWAELLARTVAHLAAQLTMTQVRLRALATELAESGATNRGAVGTRVRAIAAAETATYLRENLGEALVDVIDVEALEADIVTFLSADE